MDALGRYHEYLEKNYKCGIERFFSPTGSLEKFQKCVEVSARKTRDVVIAKSVDDAVLKLKSVVDGGEGVFDLAAEPGSGKTSVLPFKFPSKRVVVALPTPFDAWSAFQIASGPATLKLKGLTLGDNEGVCYMDSYFAANMLLSGFVGYDILIVDECDSGKGVTKFLADVGAEGKVLIRMSASHGQLQTGPSRSFAITEDTTLPDIRDGVDEFVEVAKEKLSKRSLVLLPDSETARVVAEKIPGSKLVASSVNLATLASNLVEQGEDGVFVADDICARGLNLNIDVLIDSQLVTEHAVTRHLTDVELHQRKWRVGRNKPGWYVSPGLPTIHSRESEADMLRSNVMRAIAGVEQEGPADRHLKSADAESLLCADVEPITIHRFKPEVKAARRAQSVGSTGRQSSRDSASSFESVKMPARRRVSRESSESAENPKLAVVEKKREPGSVSTPGWFTWFMSKGAVESVDGKKYYVSESLGPEYSHIDRPAPSSDAQLAVRHRKHRHGSRDLAVAKEAPYAVIPKPREAPTRLPMTVPENPPVVDLTELEYHMDWPSVIRDCLSKGLDLPTIVPPGNWRHTSVGGIGTNWTARLENLAVGELTFIESEFEIVCRAWNKMVAQAWVKRAPGLSSLDNEDKIEFCVRYFQSYFQLYSL